MEELFILKLNFQKDKVVGGKTQVFVISPFVPPVLFFLKLGFEGQFFMEMLSFYLLYIQPKKQYFSFSKKAFRFLFFCFFVFTQ